MTCMPCKPIRRNYSSKNEVILPSDRQRSLACHAVPHVSEIARQRVSPLVSGVRAGLSGLRRVRVVSVPPFPLELVKRNIFARSIDRNPEQNDEGGAFPLVRQASSSDMTCYSAVHLLHFYVSKSLHSYMGGVQNTVDLILIEG